MFTEYSWTYGCSPRIDMKMVYEKIAEAPSEEMKVIIDPGDFNHIRIEVSYDVSVLLNLYFLPGRIEVTVSGPDDECEWKYTVAEHLSDDFTLTLLDQHLDDPFGLIGEYVGEFCDRILYLHRAFVRIREMAENKVAAMI